MENNDFSDLERLLIEIQNMEAEIMALIGTMNIMGNGAGFGAMTGLLGADRLFKMINFLTMLKNMALQKADINSEMADIDKHFYNEIKKEFFKDGGKNE